MFQAPTLALADAKAEQSAAVFGYRLDYRTQVLGGVLGAHHSLDLPLVFDNADRSPTTGQRPERLAVAAEMSSAWARFARFGNPAGGKVSEWAQYGPGRGVLVFGDSPTFAPCAESSRPPHEVCRSSSAHIGRAVRVAPLVSTFLKPAWVRPHETRNHNPRSDRILGMVGERRRSSAGRQVVDVHGSRSVAGVP